MEEQEVMLQVRVPIELIRRLRVYAKAKDLNSAAVIAWLIDTKLPEIPPVYTEESNDQPAA